MILPVFFQLSLFPSPGRLSFFQYRVNATDSELKKPAITVNKISCRGIDFCLHDGCHL
jgi:hypothetical protein